MDGSKPKIAQRAKFIIGTTLISAFSVAIIVCSIVDIAINNAFTWSRYTISSIIFACCVIFPIILRGIKRSILSLGFLTVLILPYLYALDRIAETKGLILKVGGVVSVIVLAFLWLMCPIMRLCKNRISMGIGIMLILAAPLTVLINYSLSLTLTPEAAAFDVWDVLDIVILVTGGIGLILIDLVLKKIPKKQ